MDEFDLIHRFFAQERYGDTVIEGVGDDGAVLRPRTGRDLVSVVDTSVANVHFPESLAPADVGYRAVAVNLSDIAAMGATPRWMLLALTLPESDLEWLSEFSAGLFEAAAEYEVDLVGGDTTSGDSLVISIHMLGDAVPEKIIRRDGAGAGDELWLSGSTGDAAAGLRLLGASGARNDNAEYLIGRFCRPLPRITVGQAIADFATAAIDVSDGLYADLQKMVESSGVAATLDLGLVPQSSALRELFQNEAQSLSLSGGDDYELCFSVPAEKSENVSRVAQDTGVALTRIGEISEGSGVVCYLDGATVPFDDSGYRHFAEDKA
jgi:thiamine-monophosphate kinase